MRKEWMAHFIYWLRKEIKKNTWPHLDIKSFFECTTQNEIYENKMKFMKIKWNLSWNLSSIMKFILECTTQYFRGMGRERVRYRQLNSTYQGNER